ncbi:MAG: hypothetical protein HYX78_11115 [Armatimonadetes bacterium]|nr:hypothetical protein [Armatimonadota bacterium]
MRAVLIVIALVAAVAVGSAGKSKITSADVLARVERNYAAIRDSRVDVEVTIDSPQVRMPKSTGAVCFKRPDKVKVIAKDGLMVMPKDVFPGDPVAAIKRQFDTAYDGTTTVDGVAVYVLNLVPRSTEVNSKMKLFVEKRRGLIVGSEASVGGGTFKSRWTYARIDGKYWLPSKIKVEMDGALSQPAFDPDQMKMKPPKSGKGTAVVKFSNYRINKGIPDSVFEDER